MSRVRSLRAGAAIALAAMWCAGQPATAQDSRAKAPKDNRKAVHAPVQKSSAPPAAAGAPSGSIPMDFSGMSRRVQDVHSDSNAHSNATFNGESHMLSPGSIPSATMKF